MVWVSPLFFRGSLGIGLWFAGLLLAFAAWIGMAMLGWRSALTSTALAVVSAGVFLLCAPVLHRQSLRFYVRAHRAELTRIVGIMKPVTGARTRRLSTCELPGFPARECATVTALMREAGTYSVWKERDSTLFELYGWIDNRGGIRHCPGATAETCARRGRHIDGDWYSWAR